VDRLPGPATRAIYTLAGAARGALDALDEHRLAELAAAAALLAAWARRCAELAGDHPGPDAAR
jgi:hypothetical protein